MSSATFGVMKPLPDSNSNSPSAGTLVGLVGSEFVCTWNTSQEPV